MNEFTEEELVYGLKEAYTIINKDFNRLTYLNKIIKTIISKDDKDIIIESNNIIVLFLLLGNHWLGVSPT